MRPPILWKVTVNLASAIPYKAAVYYVIADDVGEASQKWSRHVENVLWPRAGDAESRAQWKREVTIEQIQGVAGVIV